MTVTPVKAWADDRSGTIRYYIDGKELMVAGEVPLALLSDYTRGYIIRGGAADWEAYAANTDGAILIGDGTDIVSDTTPSIAGMVTFRDGFVLTTGGDADLNNYPLYLDADRDTYIISNVDDFIYIYVAGALDFLFSANSFWVQAGSQIIMGEDTAIGFSGGGRIIFDSTPNPDQAMFTSLDLNMSGNDIIVPDNTADALTIYDTNSGGINYLRIISTDAQPIVRFNDGGIDADFYVEAVGHADALFIRGSDGQITLGALGAGIVMSDAGGVLSVTAGTPVVDGGGAAGEVAYWSDGTTITSEAAFAYNSGTNTLTVGAIDVSSGGDVDPADASGQDLGDSTHRWDLYTQAVYFGGATGDNVIGVPDNVADALHIQDGGATEYLKIISTDAQPIVRWNDGGADVDYYIEASGVADAFVVQGSDGQITLGALGVGLVQSTAGGVLSSSYTIGASITADDYFTNDGGTIGISGNELITFNAAAGTIVASGISGFYVEDGDYVGASGCAWLFDSSNTDISTTASLGLGTTTPGNKLDIVTGATTYSAVHIGEAIDEGGYITSITDSMLILSGGVEYDNGSWRARATSASIISMSSGAITLRTNASLTDGNTYSPTTRLTISNAGAVSVDTGDLSVTLGDFSVDAGDAYVDDIIWVNEIANAWMTNGITLTQDAGTNNEIFCGKNGNVAQSFTDYAEADTFVTLQKHSSGAGGALFRGFRDNGDNAGWAMVIQGYLSENVDTTKGVAAGACIVMDGLITDGSTGIGNMNADGNIICFRTNRGDVRETVALIDEDGDIHLDASANEDSWDEYDDVALLHGLRASLASDGSELKRHWGQWIDYARPVLERTGVITYNDDGHHFMSIKGVQMLTIDTLRQHVEITREAFTELYERCQRYENALLRAGLLPEVA